MTALKIVLGNQNYSSWSLRPWLVLKHLGVPFEEVVIPLDQPQTRQQILRYSPSARVPVLLDGDLAVWDSLAICEYLHEKFPERHLWPADSRARTIARSVSAEMHSGFAALREDLPMKFRESLPMTSFRAEVRRDIERIFEIWTQCRRRFGGGQPFLFGAFSIADAMYGPVVSRFRTYGVKLDGAPAEYVETMLAMPAMKDWLQAARAETHRMARYEAQRAQ
jgi:glutathione S-transferase